MPLSLIEDQISTLEPLTPTELGYPFNATLAQDHCWRPQRRQFGQVFGFLALMSSQANHHACKDDFFCTVTIVSRTRPLPSTRGPAVYALPIRRFTPITRTLSLAALCKYGHFSPDPVVSRRVTDTVVEG